MGSATAFQVRAKALVDAAMTARGLHLSWTEEEGNLYPGELMILGRSGDGWMTVWLYDDGIDAQTMGHPIANFEAESYSTEDALLQHAVAHIEQAVGTQNVRA